MSEQHETTRRAKLWWWIGGGAALVVVGLLAAGLIYIRGQEIWTDGMDLSVTHDQATVREVLWTPPEPMAEEFNTPGEEYEVCLSPDDSEMYFVRGLPGKGADLFVSRRLDGAWSAPRPVTSVNTTYDELGPRLSRDGQTLLFYSNRPGGLGGYDIWAAVRGLGGWRPAVNLGPAVNGPHNEYGPAMDAKGERLFFSTNRTAAEKAGGALKWQATIRQGELGDYDLFMADLDVAKGYVPPVVGPPTTRPAASRPATPPLPFVARQAIEVPGVNSPHHEGTPCVSPAGDFLYFASNRGGGAGGFDLYRVRITDVNWPEPEALGGDVNTQANETDPQLVAGGFRMYFSSDREGDDGNYDLYVTTSREVYTDRQGRPMPQLGWSVWAFLAALALLIPLLLFLKAGGYKHLSTIQKCAVASLLLHVLLTLLFSVHEMSQQIIASLRDEGSMEATLDLSIANRVQIVSEIRNQLSDLPVADARQATVDRADTDLPPLEAARVPQPEISPSRVAPTSRMDAPVIERPRPPAPADGLQEPEPTLVARAPTLDMDILQPRVSRQETRPEAAPDRVDPVVSPRANQPVVATAAEAAQVATAAPPAPPMHSIVVTHRPDRPPGREAPDDPVPAAVFLDMPLELDAPAIDVPRARPDLSEQEMPPNVGAPVRTAQRRPTTMPASRARTVAADAPKPSLTTRSQAKVAPVARDVVRIAADTVEPKVELVEMAALAPSVPDQTRGPVKSAAPRRKVSVADPGEVARRVSGDPAASQARTVATALPTTKVTGRSSVTSRTEPRAPARLAPVDIPVDDLSTPEGPRIAMGPAPSRAAARDEAAPPASTVDAATTVKTARAKVWPRVDQARPVALAMRTETSPHRRTSLIEPNAATNRALDAPRIDGDELAPPEPILPEQLPPSMLESPNALPHRSVLRRPDLVKKMGGTPKSEEAVERALRYLASTQQGDGRWTTITDRYTRRKRRKGQADIALTGLAVLSNLAGGYTPAKPSEYQRTVSRGLEYLLARQGKDGNLWESGGRMYGHAIATLALGEAAAMTGDEKYRQATLQAAQYIIRAQHRGGGGWRYAPGEKGDTSVFGWCVMALHSAERVGMTVPKQTHDGAWRYLAYAGGGKTGVLAGYQGRGQTPAMSAEAAFSRMLLGQELNPAQRKELGSYLLKTGRDKENYYCWYYASMAMFQLGQPYWEAWNPKMRDHLIRRQVRGGTDDGSWPNTGRYAGHNGGGKIYTTTMAALTLEVYYRYLPMFGGKKGTVGDHK